MPERLAREVERVRALIRQRLGLSLDDTRLPELAALLEERMRARGCAGFEAFWAGLANSAGMRDELRALAEGLTVGETYFFRNPDQFQAFVEVAMPDRLQHGGELRILSAGCASGEEPYSAAIHVREAFPGAADRIRIQGVDVNPCFLRKAAQARYAPWSLRSTSAERRGRWFVSEGDHFRLADTMRPTVAFAEANLLEEGDWSSPGRYDVVFCRNVLIYFVPEAVQALVERLTRTLAPGGYLFLGHAETLRGISSNFHLLHHGDAFFYQRKDVVAAPAPIPALAPASESVHRALALDTAWVDAIGHASRRIAGLDSGGEADLTRVVPPAARLSPASCDPHSREEPKSGVAMKDPAAAASATLDLAEAWELLRQERFGDAADLLRARPAAAADADAQLLLAVVLSHRGALDETEEVCRRVLSLDEMNAGAHYLIALCREHAGDVRGAEEHDRFAVYLDSDFAMAHFHLGLLARRSGRTATARQELAEAHRLLAREDPSRILLFGGGFGRDALLGLYASELRAVGGGP